jgi:hypothetical protein
MVPRTTLSRRPFCSSFRGLCFALRRIGVQVDPANLAMRLIACQQFGVCDVQGLRELMSMQEADGGWEMGTLYQYSNKKLCLGNRGTSTALAVDAIRRCQSQLSIE